MATKLLTKREHERLAKKLSYRGGIADTSKATGLHRTTISRILENGRGETDSVAKIIAYALSKQSNTHI